MQKIQIRLTVATTISMILFNLSHPCCAQEIDDEPDRPRNKNTNIYAESICPECQELSAKGCVPKKNGTPCSIGYCCRGECVETNGIPGFPCVPPIEPYTRNEKSELIEKSRIVYDSSKEGNKKFKKKIRSSVPGSNRQYIELYYYLVYADAYLDKEYIGEIYDFNGTCPCEEKCEVIMGKIETKSKIPINLIDAIIASIPAHPIVRISYAVARSYVEETVVFNGRKILELEKPRPCHLWRYIVFGEKSKRRVRLTNFTYEWKHAGTMADISTSVIEDPSNPPPNEEEFERIRKGKLDIPDIPSPWSNPAIKNFYVGNSYCESPVCF